MTTTKDIKEEAMEQAPTCCHHWVIDTPNGPVSRGVCRRCGTKKEFHNSVPGFVGAWARSPASVRRAIDRSYKRTAGQTEDAGDDELTEVEDVTVAE